MKTEKVVFYTYVPLSLHIHLWLKRGSLTPHGSVYRDPVDFVSSSHCCHHAHAAVFFGHCSLGKKTWWKPSQHNEESVHANGATSHSPDAVRNSESSVHKYSRRHMFLMDKIENERLGSSRPARSRGKRDRDPAWVHGLQTS